MALLNKFLKNHYSHPYILVCSSKSQMLYSKDLFDQQNIDNDLIPTPKGFGEVCSTSIKFDKKDLQKIQTIVEDRGIDVQGIHSLEQRYQYDLSEIYDYNVPDAFKDLIGKVEKNKDLSLEDIVYLLSLEDGEAYEALIRMAQIISQACVGDRIELRAAIEFSNYCMKNCNYCGLRRDLDIYRYRMTEDEILEEVDKLHKIGIKTVILQSGEDPYYTTERLLSIIRSIKERYRMGITLSVGEREEEDYRRFREAGVNNYLLKIETANKRLFDFIHPDDDLDLRSKHTRHIKEAGLRAGSGGMIGLPTQTIEEIAETILFQRDFGIHMIGFGPFLPAEGTPYANEKPGDLQMNLRVTAITRIVCQHVFIPATTAIASLDPEGQTLALKAGANTIMLISTPQKVRDKYQIYSSKNMVDLSFAIRSTRDAGKKLPKYLNFDYIKDLGYEIEDSLIN